jgi:hypothetical protein
MASIARIIVVVRPVLCGDASIERAGYQSANRCLRDAKGAGNVGLTLAGLKTLSGFLPLIGGQRSRSAKLDATLLSALHTIGRAGQNQGPLKLGQTAQDRQHQLTMRRRGIGPSVMYRLEGCTSLATASIMLSRSRVDLASRSSRVTIKTSPTAKRLSALASSLRSVLAPETFSANIWAQPA